MAAGNELKATLIVDASSVPKTLEQVSASIKKTEGELKKLGPASSSASTTLNSVGSAAKALPSSFSSVSTSIAPVLGSFQGLRVEGTSAGGAIKSLIGSLIGGGGIGVAMTAVTIGVSFLVRGLINLIKGTDDSKKSVEANKAALEQLGEELKRAKKSLDDMIGSIQFANELGQINIKVAFGTSGKGAKLGLESEVLGLRDEAFEINKSFDTIRDKLVQFRAAMLEAGDFDQLEAGTKKFQDELDALTAKSVSNVRKQNTNYAQQRLLVADTEREVQKKIDDAREAAHKKELARLAAIAEIMEELRRKELSFINKRRDAAQLLGIEEARKHVEEVGKQIPKRSEFVIRSNVTQELGFQFEKERLKQLKAYNDQLKEVARTISGVVTPAFDAMFDAIIAGENPLKAFFKGLIQGINDLIKKLIAAAIQALILKLITSASPAGVAGFIPGLGGLAKGLGGTANPGNFFSGGGRSINVVHSGNLVARGSDLVYVFDRTGRSQRRTG